MFDLFPLEFQNVIRNIILIIGMILMFYIISVRPILVAVQRGKIVRELNHNKTKKETTHKWLW